MAEFGMGLDTLPPHVRESLVALTDDGGCLKSVLEKGEGEEKPGGWGPGPKIWTACRSTFHF
eukprot:SAG31_NODE_13287_length_879_cov_1.891026_1_plen_61_part_01